MRNSGGRAGGTALPRPPSAKCRADMGHDAIDSAVANVAVIGQAALTAAPKKALETLMERPPRILLARVFGVQELPCEGIDVAFRSLARPATDSGAIGCFRPGISPPRIHNITSLNRKGSPTEPAGVGYSTYSVDLRCRRPIGHCLAERDLPVTIGFDNNRTSSRGA
jgi:hypothetical protein